LVIRIERIERSHLLLLFFSDRHVSMSDVFACAVKKVRPDLSIGPDQFLLG